MSLKIIELEDLVENLGLPGLGLGIGAVILVPILGSALAKVGKPLAKTVVKTGIVTYQKTKGLLVEVAEGIEDIVAESRAELAETRTPEALSS